MFDFKKDPFENFLKLFHNAETKGIPDHNAMTLSTVNVGSSSEGSESLGQKNINNQIIRPTSRIVYLKGISDGGFCFYTNYTSDKGQQIDQNPAIAINFFWSHLEQQICIEGLIEKVSSEQSDQYFASRPRLSQIGAWTSLQSQKMQSYDEFSKRFEEMSRKFENQKVPRPPHWGGYRILPLEIEFWFGKMGRLHERYVYQRESVRPQSQWQRFMRFP